MLRYTKLALMYLGLALMLYPGTACCETPTEIESLRVEGLVDWELQSGDQVRYYDPIADREYLWTGPLVIPFELVDGKLNMQTPDGSIEVRPLKAQPREQLPQEDAEALRAFFADVPFINERLEGNPNPNLGEWMAACIDWTVAIETQEEMTKAQYRDDDRDDRAVVAEELALAIDTHDLVIPGSALAVVPENDPNDYQRDLWVAYKGYPLDEQGEQIRCVIRLGRPVNTPNPLPTECTEAEALSLNHGIYSNLIVENRSPLFIDLSYGETVYSLNGRR